MFLGAAAISAALEDLRACPHKLMMQSRCPGRRAHGKGYRVTGSLIAQPLIRGLLQFESCYRFAAGTGSDESGAEGSGGTTHTTFARHATAMGSPHFVAGL